MYYKCKTNAITADHMAQNKVPKFIAIEQMILGLPQTKELKQRKRKLREIDNVPLNNNRSLCFEIE